MPKTYKNISGFTQFGIGPGETGEAELTQDEEDRAVDRGAIEVVDGSTSPEESAESAETAEETEKTPEEIEAEEQAAKEQAEREEREAAQRGRRGR